MRVRATELPEVLLIEPELLEDSRGSFAELYQAERYEKAGIPAAFVQDNLSRSRGGTLRGLHLQHPTGQGKLVGVLEGVAWDVVADVRLGSPRFGRSVCLELSAQNRRQLWIPEGFAHGFCALSPWVGFWYKCTGYYSPDHQLTVAWNDPELAIEWPIRDPLLSPGDAAAPRLRDVRGLPELRRAR